MNHKEQYVIGINHEGGIWFYVGRLDHEGKDLPPINRYSSAIIDAKIYPSHDEAANMANIDIPRDYVRWIMKVYDCPRCNQKYAGYPALSRLDNKTEICPDCGVREAIEIAKNNWNKQSDTKSEKILVKIKK